jgi:hypothetical protein
MASTSTDTSVLQAFLEMPRGPRPGGRRLVGREQVREGIQSRLDGIPDVDYGDDRHWIYGDRGGSEWTLRLVDGKISRKDSFWKIVD